jgi:sugar phosphate isomerase/epimerase
MKKLPIALELYSLSLDDSIEHELPGMLEAVGKMGYDGVEFSGYHNHGAKELRSILDNAGLKVAGTHHSLEDLLNDEFKRTVELNHILGNKILIVYNFAESRRNSLAAWRDTCALFDELAEKLKPEGMRIGHHYRNTVDEWPPVEGEMPWEIFGDNTSADVIMQLDTSAALSSGIDPVSYLERYPGRSTTIHLKGVYQLAEDPSKSKTRWDDIFRICESTGGTEWYIIEQEAHPWPRLETVERCLKAMRAIGK